MYKNILAQDAATHLGNWEPVMYGHFLGKQIGYNLTHHESLLDV